MSSNKFILTLLSIICFGSFAQEHCAQAAIAQTCTTSRSLLTNGLNAWMSNRDTINYVGAGLFCANALLYAWYRQQYFHFDAAVRRGGSFDHNDKPTENFENRSNAGKKMCWFRNKLYPLAFAWMTSLKAEPLLGFATSYLIWELDRMKA